MSYLEPGKAMIDHYADPDRGRRLMRACRGLGESHAAG